MKRTLILAAIIAALVLFLALWGPASCRSLFTAKQEAKVSKGQAGAAIDAGAEAMNTVSVVDAKDKAADKINEEGLDAIRKAPEGKRGDAALAASCKLLHNQHLERCAGLSKAGSGKPPRPD